MLTVAGRAASQRVRSRLLSQAASAEDGRDPPTMGRGRPLPQRTRIGASVVSVSEQAHDGARTVCQE